MKKLTLIAVMTAMVLSITACGSDGGADATDTLKSSGQGEVVEESTQEVKEEAGAKKNGITMEDLLNHSAAPEEDFTFTYTTNGGVTIDGYKGTEEILVIPDTIQGKPVEKIASYTFGTSGNDCVRAVKLPDSLTELETHAFSLNENLEIIVCGSGMEKIGKACFQSCTSLRELVLNEGVESIGDMALRHCKALTSIYIPASVTSFEGFPIALCGDDCVVYGEAGSYIEGYFTEDAERKERLETYGVRFEVK